MKKLYVILLATLGAISTGYGQGVWVSAYYASWQQGYLLPSQIDYSAFTHLIHFAAGTQSNGSLTFQDGLTEAHSADVVTRVHAAGKKVLLCVFIGNSAPMSNGSRPTLISQIVSTIQARNYDGVDLDYEPPSDATLYQALVTELRAAMPAGKLITTALGDAPTHVAPVASLLDQINIMTYDMSGAWGGWVVWHNSPVKNSGVRFPSTGGLLPSAEDQVNHFINAGIPSSKIGFGFDMYGYYWYGATRPLQGLGTVTGVRANVSYHEIMDTYPSAVPEWDDTADAAYLSIDNAGTSNDRFVSYDNEYTAWAKAQFVQDHSLGGVIIWELGGGWRPNLPAGQRDFLLQSVKQAFAGLPPPPPPSPDTLAPVVTLTAPANGATVSNTIAVTANATDDRSVAGVQFRVDGVNTGNEDGTSPYSINFNTWSVPNGTHTLQAVARDYAGNYAVSQPVSINVSNTGTPPVIADKIVYDDAIGQGFSNNSWATVDFNNTSPVRSGTKSIKVVYAAWGGLSFTFSAMDPAAFDTLKFDIYPASQFGLAVYFALSPSGTQVSVPFSAPAGQWTSVAIPVPSTPFGQFWIFNNTGGTQTAYVDNILFNAVQVGPPPELPTGTFTASPDTLPAGGGNVTLTWTSSGAASASIDHGIGIVSLNGSTTVTVPSTRTFSLALTNGGGTRTYTARVGVALPGGHGPQDITSLGAPIALFPHPNGGGNPDIEVIRDGDTPATGDTSLQRQFDTFMSGEQRDVDWIGYQYATERTFSGVMYQEGLDNQWGGCFTNLTVQVKSGNTWSNVVQQTSTPSYPGSNLVNYESFDIAFTPVTGTAIRIYGPPSGVGHYIGVGELRVFGTGTTSSDPTPAVPKDYALRQNYPNPFNPTTTISYSVPNQENVRIDVYNILGQHVRTLVSGVVGAGSTSVIWDGRNDAGALVPSGTYVYRMAAGAFVEVHSMIFLK